MMTLQLRRCVSLFVCLSLLLSACSPDKSSKASSKANEFARNTEVEKVKMTESEKEEKVELAYDLCSEKGTVTVDAGKSIDEAIGKMKCTTENGKTTCKEGDKTKCELEKVELCNDKGEGCKDFEFGETKVLCSKPSDKSKGACLPMRLRGEEMSEELVKLARQGVLTPNQQKRMAKWARERLISEEQLAALETLSPEQQDEYLELKSKMYRAERRVKQGTLAPVDKEAVAPEKVADEKALTPEQQEKMAVLTELMQMRRKAVATDLTPKEQEELATLLVKGVKALTPEEQKRKATLTKLMLVTPEEEAEFDRMKKKRAEAEEKELTEGELAKFKMLSRLKSLAPDEQEELATLLVKGDEAAEKALTEEEREKFEVLSRLKKMPLDDKKYLLAKMKATDMKEWQTLSAKVWLAGKKVLPPEEGARITKLLNLLKSNKALTPEEQEDLDMLLAKAKAATKNVLTPKEQERKAALENLMKGGK